MNTNEPTSIHLHTTVPPELTGTRVDIALATIWPQFSRSRFKNWLEQGFVRLQGRIIRAKDKVCAQDTLEVDAPAPQKEKWSAQALPLSILHEDEALLIINKSAGCVTHPAPGHYDGTLVNALIHHDPTLQQLPRAGLIHRLDKDTSGLLVVAKTWEAHHYLVKELQARRIKRHYEAIVKGVLTGGGCVDTYLGRDPKERTRMAVRPTGSGKQAITHYRVITRFTAYTHISVQLETGRTHQIRVHMAHLHHPIVGDPLYGSRHLPQRASEALQDALKNFKRQALHAKQLGFVHPLTQTYTEWIAPLPEDMQHLLTVLQHDPTR
ncbi:MAG: 23S rRNA pseudouridine(1911/1915/1917) synthase RluD [Gammaproteobacteria bacterium]|nr:23S rRNA pseudouridine(1911/1915/1917) synthase RluD [Gammaproteobacteria bacterium]